MLGLATTADAGDCKTYAGYCPELYRHGNCVIYIQLAAADFGHPSGAAYVRVTGMLLTHDCYIGGALRSVTCQQTFDLKPLRNNGIFLYRERCTIMDSQVLEFPPVLAQSAYAATFFPERYRTSTPRACSEVASDSGSLESSCYKSASAASSVDTPLPRYFLITRKNVKWWQAERRSADSATADAEEATLLEGVR
ncbi:g11008 [Coccomyxa viridis]|uniref:G11008 protein n=1 Tax=Coccomyxa viridis TaxID=1274662 RepID=A0ABP1G6V5_9CHLO